MTRLEFMEELRSRLQTLPFTEQQDALRYYEEYFDDAGPDNEQKVVEELGTPEEVAKNILANSSLNLANSPYRDGGRPPQEGFQPMGIPKPQKSKTGLWIFLACTSIIWGPVLFAVAITLLSILFSVLVTLFSLAVAFAILCVVLIVLFFAALAIGIPLLFGDTLNGLLLISMALTSAGAVLVFVPLTWLLFRYGIPGFVRFNGGLLRKLTGKTAQ